VKGRVFERKEGEGGSGKFFYTLKRVLVCIAETANEVNRELWNSEDQKKPKSTAGAAAYEKHDRGKAKRGYLVLGVKKSLGGGRP